MLQSVTANRHSFEECKEILRKSAWCDASPLFHFAQALRDISLDIKLDPGFKEFYTWCKANDVPVIIVSRHAQSSHLVIEREGSNILLQNQRHGPLDSRRSCQPYRRQRGRGDRDHSKRRQDLP